MNFVKWVYSLVCTCGGSTEEDLVLVHIDYHFVYFCTIPSTIPVCMLFSSV